jgi:hypothetical protein
MPNSGPPWVESIQAIIVVDNKPVPSQPTTEAAAGGVGRYSGNDAAYQTVVSWTVATRKVGELKEITVLTTDYTYSVFRITIAGKVWANDWVMQAAMPIIFEDLKLAAGDVVLVEVKTAGTAAILVDAIIVAKEIG